MPSRSELDLLYQIGSQLAPAIHQAQNWPYDVPHAQYEASLWPPHDVGGQPDAPVRYEEKEEEQWELDTYVTCEVLGWKGVWNAEERRRRGNNDIGLSLYYDSPTTDVGSCAPQECWSIRTTSRCSNCSKRLRK